VIDPETESILLGLISSAAPFPVKVILEHASSALRTTMAWLLSMYTTSPATGGLALGPPDVADQVLILFQLPERREYRSAPINEKLKLRETSMTNIILLFCFCLFIPITVSSR
jgi:hypothetical protein